MHIQTLSPLTISLKAFKLNSVDVIRSQEISGMHYYLMNDAYAGTTFLIDDYYD